MRVNTLTYGDTLRWRTHTQHCSYTSTGLREHLPGVFHCRRHGFNPWLGN